MAGKYLSEVDYRKGPESGTNIEAAIVIFI
jgi:hypothetical protein